MYCRDAREDAAHQPTPFPRRKQHGHQHSHVRCQRLKGQVTFLKLCLLVVFLALIIPRLLSDLKKRKSGNDQCQAPTYKVTCLFNKYYIDMC